MFGSAGGSIDVNIEAHPDRWMIVCRDNGSAGAAEAERAAKTAGLGTRVIQSIASSLNSAPQCSANGDGMLLRLDSAVA